MRPRQVHEDLRLLHSREKQSGDVKNAASLHHAQTNNSCGKARAYKMAPAQSAGATVCLFADRNKTHPHDMANASDHITTALVRSPGGETVNGASSFSNKGVRVF